eukprot:scaffold13528_cov169-Amphora_coffeaeformis.AAC.14
MKQSLLFAFVASCLGVTVLEAEQSEVEYGVDVVSHLSRPSPHGPNNSNNVIMKSSSPDAGYLTYHFLVMLVFFCCCCVQSYPMHHEKVSTNYPWLPHNADPANNPTPP